MASEKEIAKLLSLGHIVRKAVKALGLIETASKPKRRRKATLAKAKRTRRPRKPVETGAEAADKPQQTRRGKAVGAGFAGPSAQYKREEE